MNWLDTLKLEMEHIDINAVPTPDEAVAKGETVAGIVDSETRKLYMLSHLWAKSMAEILVKAAFGTGNEKNPETVLLLDKLKAQAQAARELFWICVRDQMNLWDKDSITLRKDWQIVFSNGAEETEDVDITAVDITDVIRKALGIKKRK